eukprot:1160861_1
MATVRWLEIVSVFTTVITLVSSQSYGSSNSSTIVIDDDMNNVRHPISNHSFGKMDILDDVHVEFDFKVLSNPTQTETNILHIGSNLHPHLPSIRVEDSSGVLKVSVWFSLFDNLSARIDHTPISLNTWYHLSFDLTQSTANVSIDGIPIATRRDQGSHAILRKQDIYILSHPHYPSMDGLVRDMTITTDNAYATPFNYLCDYDNRFKMYDGTWTIDPSTCWLRQTTDAAGGALVWLGDVDATSIQWTDYSIEIVVRLLATDHSTGHAGVLFRALSVNGNLNGGQQYLVDLQPDENAIRLSTIDDGITSEHQDTTETITIQNDYTIRVDVLGSTISVYLDGQHKFDHVLTQYTHGSIGLRTHRCDARFKSLRIMFPNINTRITLDPTASPTRYPTNIPTGPPIALPTAHPTTPPTYTPTHVPTAGPSLYPTDHPTKAPTLYPTLLPSSNPTNHPTLIPTWDPSHPTLGPTQNPTNVPTTTPVTLNPSVNPTHRPTLVVSVSNPSKRPLMESTVSLKDIMISTPSTDENAVNLELLLWISLPIVGICLVVCIIVCVKRRVRKADNVRKDTEVYIEAVNSNNSAMVEMISERKPEITENVNKQAIEEPVVDITKLIEWLTSEVKLPQYVSNFADNGYETMQFVRDISTAEEL